MFCGIDNILWNIYGYFPRLVEKVYGPLQGVML